MEVNILLVIVGGIIAIGAIVGFAKGAVRIAVSLGATILTLAVVYFATPYVSKAIYSLTPIDEMVEQQCIKTMTKAFTGEADTNSGFTEEQVRGILSAAGVSEQTLEAAGITVEDIVNGNVSDEMLQQYGISPDIFDGHVSTEEAEQSIMEAEVPKQMQIVAIEGADLPDVFKNLLLENNNSEVYQKLGVTTFAEYVSKYFAKLVIEEVRKQVGPFFPIFVRISADELMEGGNTLEDTLEYLKYFEKEVDVFDVSCGLNGSIQYQIDANYLPDGWRSFMAKAVKEKYNKPCITVGNIRDPQVAEDILAGGDADFIGMGRGLIADPEWVNKVEFGNVCDIRKCISCNIGCAGHRIGLNQPIRCTVNPAVNSGEDYMKTKVNKPCNVVVIGGGTAGLEAACTAAEVGCTTFLIEKKAELGGLASVISKIPDKKRLADFPNYMIHRASKLHNLFVFKNTSATVDMVKALNPDIIVNATGSVPTLPPITGLHDLVDKDGTNVATVLKMIERINEYPEDMKGQKIAIIGGGAVGLDVMEFFTERGAEVTMVEMLPMIGNGLDPVTKCDTNAKMAKYGVKQMTNTALQEVKNDRFIVKNPEGEIEEIPFDYGFICLGMRANTPVLSEIDEAFSNTNVEIVNIGDSKRARRIIEGTEEGRNILNVLARHDYL